MPLLRLACRGALALPEALLRLAVLAPRLRQPVFLCRGAALALARLHGRRGHSGGGKKRCRKWRLASCLLGPPTAADLRHAASPQLRCT